MKRYKAKRGGMINIFLLFFIVLPIAIFLVDTETFSTKPVILLPLLLPILYFLWISFDTYYLLEGSTLKYKSGFLKGSIKTAEIKEIISGKTLWAGTKPSLASNGLIIKYKPFKEIYFAPESNEEMIHDLLIQNPDIKVTYFRK
jgi:hypothetical protein